MIYDAVNNERVGTTLEMRENEAYGMAMARGTIYNDMSTENSTSE